MSVQKVCLVCSVEFFVPKYREGAKFCSKPCSYRGRKPSMPPPKLETRKCIVCGIYTTKRTWMWTKSVEETVCGKSCAGRLGKGRKRSDSMREKMRQIALERPPTSEETRRKMSQSAIKRVSNPETRSANSWARGGHRDDLGHFVRSSWEANFARVLQFLKVEYIYEPLEFRCDFYIPEWNELVEVKPNYRWNELGERNFWAYEDEGYNVYALGDDEYLELKEMYGDLVEWENV